MAGFAPVTTSQWHDGGKMAGFAHVNPTTWAKPHDSHT